MRKILLIAAAALLLTVTGCLKQAPDGEKSEKEELLVIDVRTSQEFAAGHIQDSTLIPYDRIVEGFEANKIAKDQKVVLYCRSGNRSSQAKRALDQAGWTAVTDGGGYRSMIAVGYKWVR